MWSRLEYRPLWPLQLPGRSRTPACRLSDASAYVSRPELDSNLQSLTQLLADSPTQLTRFRELDRRRVPGWTA